MLFVTPGQWYLKLPSNMGHGEVPREKVLVRRRSVDTEHQGGRDVEEYRGPRTRKGSEYRGPRTRKGSDLCGQDKYRDICVQVVSSCKSVEYLFYNLLYSFNVLC